MKTTINFVCVLAMMLVLLALPGLAQKGNAGVGVGVGLGGQTNVQAGGANVGVKTNTDVVTKTPVEAGAAGTHAQSQTSAVSRIESNPQLAAHVQSMLPSGMSMNSAA